MSENQQGFVLLTVIMLLGLFTAGAILTVEQVTANIKGTGYIRLYGQRLNCADGGAAAVFAYKMAHPEVPAEEIPDNITGNEFPRRPLGTGLCYRVHTEQVSKETSRRIRGFSQTWIGADHSFLSTSRDRGGEKKMVDLVGFVPYRLQDSGNE